jgi:hypothetical protein
MRFPKLTHTIILLLFAFLLLPTAPIRPIAGIGAEASWYQSLAMALNQKMYFGTDFIFRYGPLGFLENKFLPERVHVVAQLLFDLYILFNLLYVIHFAIKKARIVWVAIVALVAMILPWGFIADATFTLLFLFLFNLFHANENRRSFSLYNAVFIAALMFFIKVNFSLVISLLLYASLVYFWLSQRFSWREILAVVVTHLFLIYWGAYQLRVDIYNYLVSSVELIENFDDSNANIILKPQLFYTVLVIAIIITIFTLVVFFKNAKQVYKRQDYLFTFLMVFSAMYLSFKQQFTDLNAKNAMAYFLFIPPLLSLLWIFLRDSGRWFSRLAITSLVLSIIAFQLIRFDNHATISGYWKGFFPKEVVYFNAKYGGPENVNKKSEPLLDFLNIIKLHSPYGYVKSLTDNQFTTYFPKYNKQNRLLPKAILNTIGESTVDILPNESAYIFFNKLNYNPRPTIQSNQTVSSYLDQKNVEKYASKTAPEYVFSQYTSTSNRNFIWQETNTKLALISHYQKLNSISIPQFKSANNTTINDTLSLYKKRKVPLQYTQNQVDSAVVVFGKEYEIRQIENTLILKTDFKYSWKGLLTRYFFQAPFVYCFVKYSDGSSSKFRAIVPQFNSGVIINKNIENNANLDQFFSGKTVSKKTIKSIRFESKNSWGFEPNIGLKFSEIMIK